MTGGLAPGTRLGERYRIVRLLAEGGMGAVYEAQQLELGRRVAIKTLLSELQDQPRLIQRFIREARATCMIAHANVVSVLDVDQTPDGIVFFVMEYLEGADVSEVLEREGPIAWRRARQIALQVCAALAAAHERGVVHRDLKPSNCFLIRDEAGAETVKVLDFGIAKVLESNGPHAARRGPGTGRDLRWLKTSTGEVFGTLAYMAPEHLNGDPHDHRVDIYAIGVILYEMLTGATPFSPDAPGTFIQQVLFEPPEPPSRRAPNAGIPPDLDYVVLRALEKRPEDRFANMDELAAALTAIRREAAPRIAIAPWSASPVLAPVAAAAPEPVPAVAIATRPRPRIGLRTRVGLLGALALGAFVVRASFAATDDANDSAPVPAPGAASMVAPPLAEPVIAAPSAPPPAEPPTVASAEPEPILIEAVEPVAAIDAKTSRASARAPSPARARDRDRELPAMTVSPGERQKLFAAHSDAITARCKQRRSLENALVVLQITIEAARIVRAVLNGDPDRDREAAARCIDKYLRTKVAVPKSMSGRATFFYAF